MTIATEVAALLEPAPGHPGLQPISAVVGLVPIAGLKDRAMSRANHITSLLSDLTHSQIDLLAPVERRVLQDQLERVLRMVAGTSATSDARKAGATKDEPKRGRAAFFDELRDGQGRE